ncbi:MAG: M15 family metallopeptidase [Oscillospiraceae bacterium]
MNNHLQRLREQEELTRNQRRKNMRLSRLLAAMVLLCFSLTGMVGVMMSISPKDEKKSDENVNEEAVKTELSEEDKWQLILVNKERVVPADFTVDLITFDNVRVDCRISDMLRDMLNDAKKDGIDIAICSGYRSVSEQRQIYEAKVSSFLTQGYNEEASKINTNQYIQPPGASEHHTGLAVDLQTGGKPALDESFAQTPAYEWLKENAAKYGFIERYPKDKSDITGVFWEPWHFRYVGPSNAKAITSMGICLEEYV